MLYSTHLLWIEVLAFKLAEAYNIHSLPPSTTSIYIAEVTHTVPNAIPAKMDRNIGVLTSASVQDMIKQRDGLIDRTHSGKIQRRDQYIIALCPESWHGGVPKPCSSCGGDSVVPGQCDHIMLTGSQERCYHDGGCGIYCRCIPDTVDNTPGKVTSVTTVGGQAGTVVYEAHTLVEYAALQASTTVTISDVVATSTDSSSGIETFVVVIVAGGVTWWVVDSIGTVAAISAIRLPIQLPDGGKPDSDKCQKNPKQDCADCGGGSSLKLCLSGPAVGCPCDENQHCPNEPPQCSDPSCGGDNGKSQCAASGAMNGCTCCPSTIVNCLASDCDGDENSVCQATKIRGCGCLWLGDDGNDPIGQDNSLDSLTPEQVSSLAAAVFTTAWGAISSNVPGLLNYPTYIDCPYVSYTPTTSLNTGTASVDFLPVTNCYCTCGPTMTPQAWGTNSGHSTSSWCAQGHAAPGDYTVVGQGCGPGAVAISTASPSLTTTSSPTINTPPPNTNCATSSNCSKYVCPGGSVASCVAGSDGPFTSYCKC